MFYKVKKTIILEYYCLVIHKDMFAIFKQFITIQKNVLFNSFMYKCNIFVMTFHRYIHIKHIEIIINWSIIVKLQ
jgi:hypothetical protein